VYRSEINFCQRGGGSRSYSHVHESIFAWKHSKIESYGLLAPWPTCLSESNNIVINSKKFKPRVPYKVANQGLDSHVPNKLPDNGNGREWNNLRANNGKNYKPKFNCGEKGAKTDDTIAIYLDKNEHHQ